MNTKKPILLIEDDIIDVMTVKRAFKDINLSNELIVKGNGEDALDYLTNDNNAKPGIILLDLNMPRMNGIEFLQNIKMDKSLRTIPVIVLTTSNQERDVVESFNLYASGYMLKPVDYVEFLDIMRTIDSYWSTSLMPD